jgi:hypothetical protein
MPCGGIYYFGDRNSQGDDDQGAATFCLHCSRRDSFGIDHLDHFCVEWDGYLHSACVVDFLKGESGETVINHMHTLELGPTVDFNLKMIAIESVDQPRIASATEKS